ncbi:MAG: right-handed parallel beta-helix repeat-containing protein [Candidatus Thermoplasmatota archaeon]|nr:right-handed parallel beta-helix repeat-containing protein [Candidatus Thermoplasmatota archaeon]
MPYGDGRFTGVDAEQQDMSRAGIRVATEFITGLKPQGTVADPFPGTAIQAAMTDAGVDGAVYIPKGRWTISTALLPDNGQEIYGTGNGTELFVADGANVDAITITNRSDVFIHDLRIDGNADNQAAVVYGIHGESPVNRVRVKNCHIRSTRNDGILIRGNWCHIEGNYTEDCGRVGSTGGIHMRDGGHHTIVGNICENNASGAGILLISVTNGAVIMGNYIRDCFEGINCISGGSDLVIVGNVCRGSNGVGIQCTTGTFTNIVIAANDCFDNGERGIHVNVATQVAIVGNRCGDQHGAVGYGISVLNSSGVTVYGNTVANNDEGIVFSGTDDSVIEGNVVYDDQGVPTQDRGIFSSATSSNNFIFGNKLYGNISAAIEIIGGTGNVVRDNMGHETENRGTAVIANGTSSIVVPHGLVSTPGVAIATGRDLETDQLRVSARDGTNITLAVPSNVTAARTVDWMAEV